MRFTREFLGGTERYDTEDEGQMDEFARLVVQDDEAVGFLLNRIEKNGEVVVNEDDPLYIERYTKLGDEEPSDLEIGVGMFFSFILSEGLDPEPPDTPGEYAHDPAAAAALDRAWKRYSAWGTQRRTP